MSQDNIEETRDNITKVDKELEEFPDYTSEDVAKYLDLIHTYNEVKDTAQALIGVLARIEDKSTKEIYEEFDIDFDSDFVLNK